MKNRSFSSSEIENVIRLVRDKSVVAARMGGKCVENFSKDSAAQYLEKLRLLYFSRKCCDN